MVDSLEIKKVPFVLTVCSGKGGVGKSFISSNIANLAAKKGLKTLVWDADQNFPNQHIMFGVEPPIRISDVYEDKVDLSRALFEIKQDLYLLAGAPATGNFKRQNAEVVLDLYKKLLLEGDFDLVIIDTPAFSSDDVLQCCNIADLITIIINDEPTSLLDAYGLLKILLSYIEKDFVNLLVNNVIDFEDADEISMKLNMATENFLNTEIEVLGFIPYEREIRQSIIKQKLITDEAPLSDASGALKKITKIVLNKIKEPVN
jgi:flagellar biosynthesis protein FlhG